MNPVRFRPLDPSRRTSAPSGENSNGENASTSARPSIKAYIVHIEKDVVEDETFRAGNVEFRIGKTTMYASKEPSRSYTRGIIKTRDGRFKVKPNAWYVDHASDLPFLASLNRANSTSGGKLIIESFLDPDDNQFISGGYTFRHQSNSIWISEDKAEAGSEQMEDRVVKDLGDTEDGRLYTTCATPVSPEYWRNKKSPGVPNDRLGHP